MTERPAAIGPASRNPHLYLGSPKFGERSHAGPSAANTSNARDQKTLDQAQQLWTVGKHRAARAVLKEAIQTQPDATPLRLALAGYYREMNCPDQAGRWGIVSEGWTTPVERDRLARLLAPAGIPHGDLVELLQLPAPVDSYPDLQEVIDGPLAAHVAQRRAAAAAEESPWGERFFIFAAISWVTTVLGWMLAAMVLFVVAIFEIADARTVARISATCVLVLMAIACWASSAGFLAERKWVAGAVFATIGVLAAVLTVVTFATT